ncbi:hypothetical protein CEXT_795231 [Caerostris extrusa]|uniref:Uncharacterized protein n=1 Tax=Caerostris extrusa TaxID=172846 RepID=A0AAV4SC58_CAEEX|nr:hypothetical protein CEXT_795231 [Caerostris extrusa]
MAASSLRQWKMRTQLISFSRKLTTVLTSEIGLQSPKPMKRNPQFICFGVDADTDDNTVTKKCIKRQCRIAPKSDEVRVVHSYRNTKGGINWIVETSPKVHKSPANVARKINIGWERGFH